MSIWKNGLPDLETLSSNQSGTMVDHLGITVTGITDNSLTARMPVDARTLQPHGRLHGEHLWLWPKPLDPSQLT